MLHTFVEFLMYLLAIYGAITLAASVIGTVKGRASSSSPRVRIVLVVKDVEDNIESIVRNAIRGDFTSKVMSGFNLTVVDMNSSDGTAKILNELKKDFECLEVINAQDRDRVFTDIFSPSHN